MKTQINVAPLLALLFLPVLALTSPAQTTNRPGFGAQPPRVISPEVSADRKLTFRILAPKAETVRLSSSDLPGLGQGSPMTKNADGIWETTIAPVDLGAYRYNFNVDGVAVIDPRNPATS